MYNGDMIIDEVCQHEATMNKNRVVVSQGAKSLSFYAALNIALALSSGDSVFLMGNNFNCGIVQFLLISLFCAFSNVFSFSLFLRTWVTGGEASYFSLWNHSFNGHFTWVPIAIQIIAYACVCVSYTSNIPSIFASIVSSFTSSPPSILSNQWLVTYVIGFVFILPILSCKSIGSTRFYTYVSNFSLIISLICVVGLFGKSVMENGFDPSNSITYWGKSVSNAVGCFSAVNYAIFVQPLIPRVVRDLVLPTRGRVINIFWSNTFINIFLLYVGGFFSYFALFDSLSGDYSLNYFPSSNAMTIIAKFGLLIIVVLNDAEYIYIVATDICSLLYNAGDDSYFARIAAGLVVFLLVNVVNFAPSSFGDSATIAGDITYALLNYIVPCAIYAKMFKFTSIFWGLAAVITIIILIPLVVLVVLNDMGLLNF